MMRSLFFLTLLVLVLPLLVIATERRSLITFWKPLDPKVNQLAEFAVSQYNKETPKKLVFIGVVSGKSSFTAGTVYDIVIAAKNEALPALVANYDTGVWNKAGKWNLIGFRKV